jgi:hypothetical protein
MGASVNQSKKQHQLAVDLLKDLGLVGNVIAIIVITRGVCL